MYRGSIEFINRSNTKAQKKKGTYVNAITYYAIEAKRKREGVSTQKAITVSNRLENNYGKQ